MDDLKDILRHLEPSLGVPEGEPEVLDGGITNRNYRVTLGGDEYVLRRPGRDTALLGIDRTAERMAGEAAARLGIGPQVVAVIEDCLVTRFIDCAQVSAEEVAGAVVGIAHSLRAFHDSPARLPARFWVPDLIRDYAEIARARGRTLPSLYAEAADAAERIEAALALREERPCHNDLLAGNIIRASDDGRMMIVDWEYAGMGDPRFDLGNLSINNGFGDADDDRLLSAYYGAAPSDRLRAQLKLMRVLSDAREAAWGVVQGAVSELDFDFSGYAGEHFERLHAAVVGSSFSQWLGAAAE